MLHNPSTININLMSLEINEDNFSNVSLQIEDIVTPDEQRFIIRDLKIK